MKKPKKKKQKRKPPQPAARASAPNPERPPPLLLRWGHWTWITVVGVITLLGGPPAFGFLHDEWEKTKPEFHLGASDSAPKPSLPFTVGNPSGYFRMANLYVDCAGQISFKEGSLIITEGRTTFDPLPGKDGKISEFTIANTSPAPVPPGAPIWIATPFGGPHPGRAESGNFRMPDVTSKPLDLKAGETRRFDCRPLLAEVSGDYPVLSAKIKVRASYVTHFLIDINRTEDSLVYSCAWNNGKFECDDGERIAVDAP